MTVNDLIKRLQQYPSDANVELTFDYGESDCHACNVVCVRLKLKDTALTM